MRRKEKKKKIQAECVPVNTGDPLFLWRRVLCVHFRGPLVKVISLQSKLKKEKRIT